MKILEKDIEKACLQWANMLPETMAIKMQTSGTVKTSKGKQYISKSPCPGIADCLLIIKGRHYFVEFKTPKGRQSENQKAFEQELRIAGGEYYIIRSFEEFKTLVLLKSF